MKKVNLLLPLNIDNLINFLAAGVITSKDSFPIGNYMPDSLQLNPKYITLYKNKVPQKATSMVKQEDEYLFECLAKVSIKVDDTLLEQITEENPFVLDATLPVSSITEIIFEHTKAKEKYTRDVKNSNVIGVSNLQTKLTATEKGYKNFILPEMAEGLLNSINEKDELESTEFDAIARPNNLDEQNIQEVEEIEKSSLNYPKTSAYGAILAILLVMSKNGKVSNDLFNCFANGSLENIDKDNISKDFVRVFEYFYSQNNVEANPLIGIFNALVKEDKSTFLNSIVLSLKSSFNTEGSKYQAFFSRISEQIIKIDSASETRKVSEIIPALQQSFEKTNIELYLSFFAIKANIETMLNTQFDTLREQDYLMLAIFYAMRDGYHGLPKFIRNYQNNESFVAFKMAQYANKQKEVNIELAPVKKPPTLIDLLDGTNLTIENKIALSHKLGLNECINIELKAKDFDYVNGAIKIPLSTKPKFVISRVEKSFTKRMLKIKPEDFNYNDIIKLVK